MRPQDIDQKLNDIGYNMCVIASNISYLSEMVESYASNKSYPEEKRVEYTVVREYCDEVYSLLMKAKDHTTQLRKYFK